MKRKSHKSQGHGRCSAYRPQLPQDYPWKVLDALCHDVESFLKEQDVVKLRDIIRSRNVPKLLSLAEEWGLQSSAPYDVCSCGEFAAKYQLSALLKRYRFPGNNVSRTNTAILNFLKAEQSCEWYNAFGANALACTDDPVVRSWFTYARAFISKVLGEIPSTTLLMDASRHGPGATLSTRDGLVSKYHKYLTWPYDCTQDALGYARLLIAQDARWLGALEDDYRRVMEIPKWKILSQEKFWANVLTPVPGNRITFVPKDAVKDRSIAIEPVMNLMLQLGVDGYIRRRLKHYGVNLDSQEMNQVLAYMGSVKDGPDGFSTIDLKSASDTVSTALCELLLPPLWYDYLMSIRSPQGDLYGEKISYEKISSMGNGCTFAIESLLFAAIVYAVMKTRWGEYYKTRCAIFGDDIVVPNSIASDVISFLAWCGFAVNPEKTFLKGPVRESCGTDWFAGHLIRPVFLEEIPTHVKALWTDRNRLRRKLYLQWGLEESKVESLLDSWVPGKFQSFRGPNSNVDFDSYMHSNVPPEGVRYKRGTYEYRRLIYRPVPLKGNSFLFRKLMHDLRGRQSPVVPGLQGRIMKITGQVSPDGYQRYIVDLALAGAGSRFDVTKRNSVTSGVTRSLVSYWQEEYEAFSIWPVIRLG